MADEGIWRRIFGIFFQDDEEGLDMEELSMEAPQDVWHELKHPELKRPQVQAVPCSSEAKKDYEIVIIDVKDNNDLENIARKIKEQKVIIVNFMLQNSTDVQRMLDFFSGAVFALDSETKRISDASFLFSSSRVDLSGQIMEQKEQKSDKTEENKKNEGFSL